MAMSVNPAIEGNQPLSSGHCDPAAMIGPRSTVPIRARGHGRAAATGRTHDRNWPPLHARKKLLRAGGHPHMTARVASPAEFRAISMVWSPDVTEIASPRVTPPGRNDSESGISGGLSPVTGRGRRKPLRGARFGANP